MQIICQHTIHFKCPALIFLEDKDFIKKMSFAVLLVGALMVSDIRSADLLDEFESPVKNLVLCWTQGVISSEPN